MNRNNSTTQEDDFISFHKNREGNFFRSLKKGSVLKLAEKRYGHLFKDSFAVSCVIIKSSVSLDSNGDVDDESMLRRMYKSNAQSNIVDVTLCLEDTSIIEYTLTYDTRVCKTFLYGKSESTLAMMSVMFGYEYEIIGVIC